MHTSLKTAIFALVVSAATAPAFAQSYDQLAANAGLTQSEAAGLTDAQIAAYFFNRGKSVADRQPIPGGSPAMSSRTDPDMTRRAAVAEMANRGESFADRQPLMTPVSGTSADRSQLAASAGLGIDGAEGRSLTDLANALYNRGMSTSDKW